MRPILTYDLIQQIAQKVEDLCIETQCYKSKLINLGITPADLQRDVETAQQNPQIRAQVHANFAEMWELLKEGADWFVTQDLAEAPPPTDEQN